VAQSFIRLSSLAFICSTLLLSGCTTTLQERANLKRLYDKSAQYHEPDRNPVIVIPGILGSKLVDDSGTTVWGAFRKNYANPNTDDGARLVALPIGVESEAISYIETNVRPDGVLENLDVNLIGFPISIQAYAGILSTLGAGGYRDEALGLNSIDYGTDHFTCFQFDYDWRQDIPSNAARLKTFIDERRKDVQASYKRDYGIENAEVKFDLVAHSMGAVLARYFTRYGAADLATVGQTPVTWAGAKDVDRLISIAPPNAGSLEAMDQLINGFNTGRPILPHYTPALIGSFPSVYQLLPRARHDIAVWNEDTNQPVEDLLDPELWEQMEWGLSGKDKKTEEALRRLLPDIDSGEDRRAIAQDFQRKALQRARQFQIAMDSPAQAPEGLEMFLVAGDNRKTPEVASIDKSNGDFSILKYGLGDDVVLRSSALLDERMGQEWKPNLVSPIDWQSTLFIPGKHRTITSGPIFEDNVLYWLLEEPRE